MVKPSWSSSTAPRRRYGPLIGIAGLLISGTAPASGQVREPAGRDQPQETVAPEEVAARPPPGTRGAAWDDPHDLYLEVLLGDRPTGRIVHARLWQGGLSMAPDALRTVGIDLPLDPAESDDGMVLLETVPGLAYRYEAATQRLVLHALPSLLPMQSLGYRSPASVEVHRDAGWLLSYDAYARQLDGGYSLAAATSLRWFGRPGAIELTGVSRVGVAPNLYRRLDLNWTYSDPSRLWTWTVGDLISGGLSWARPVRMGGVQWRRNFGVRPDLVTLPMPRFAGETAVPAAVELYVDNVRQFEGRVQEGPFVLDVVPRVSGAGEASLVMTDVLGRVTETRVPLYVDHERLARGLTDFSFEAGLLRSGYAGENDGYGRNPVVSASIRRGVSNSVTIEGHGEAGAGLRLAGIGTVWSPGSRWGLAAASYSTSAYHVRGSQYTLGYQWNSAAYGVDFQRLRRSRSFRDLGDMREGTGASLTSLRAQDRATLWLPVMRGNLAFTWIHRRDHDGAGHPAYTVSSSQAIGRLTFSASLFDDLHGRGGGALSLIMPLGPGFHVSGGVRSGNGQVVPIATVRHSAPYQGGWGWSAQGGGYPGDPGASAQASAEVRGRSGEMQFGIDHRDGRSGGFLQGGGSLAMMGGRLFASRRIHDGFAVISTGGQGDVPVLSENLLYGRTDSRGYLLVPSLRSWQRNRIAIDPDHLNAAYRLGSLEQVATPADRSGVFLYFEVVPVRPALVALLGPSGEPVPAGSRGILAGSTREIVIGFDGEAYIPDLAEDAVIEVQVEGVRCRFPVREAAVQGSAAFRGEPVPCRKSEP